MRSLECYFHFYSGTLVRKAGPNKGSYSGDNMGEDGEEIDERLKNIDPKMVELIMAEVCQVLLRRKCFNCDFGSGHK